MLNSESSSKLYLSTELNLLFKILRVFCTAVIHDEIKHGRHDLPAMLDTLTMRPPDLLSRGRNTWHIFTAARKFTSMQSLYVAIGWISASMGHWRTPALFTKPHKPAGTRHETTVKSWLVQNRRDESFHTFYCGHPHPHNTHTQWWGDAHKLLIHFHLSNWEASPQVLL